MSDPASYTYLPWLRQGLAGLIPTEDTLDHQMAGRARLPVVLTVDADGTGSDTPEVQVDLRGPGDVAGLEASAVLRTEPVDGAADVEPNYMAAVEFERADLPWMFTPAAGKTDGKLRPWMVLVVVEDRVGVRIESSGGVGLDKLVIDDQATSELPDLADSWGWAHVQVSGPVGGIEALQTILDDTPHLVVSRLVCPRFLKPDTRWIACVVPAFDSGKRAGLGTPLTDVDFDELHPAWGPTDVSMTLPVYHHWSFTTGQAGDFETLARRLQPVPLPTTVGVRALDVGHAGSGLADNNGDDVLTQYRGALVSPTPPADPWPPGHRTAFVADLTAALSVDVQPDAGADDPVVGPPLYGRWHAAVDGVPPIGGDHPWLRQMNLHPGRRAAAGLAADVIRERQESLMQAAWEQVGEVMEVNRTLRQAQLAREAGKSVRTRHFDTLPSDDARVQLAAPMLARTQVNGVTGHAELRDSNLPDGTTSGTLRRVARPRGPSSRQVGGDNTDWSGRLLGGLANPGNPLDTANDLVTPKGMGTTTHIAQNWPVPGAADDKLSGLDVIVSGFSDFTSDYSDPTAPDANLTDVQAAVGDTLDPSVAVLEHVKTVVAVDPASGRDDWNRDEPLDPILAAPEFTEPVYDSIPTKWLVPGIEAMEADSVGILEVNPKFVESFMVGLSHEMARELLWREYPTDQRGTYFRQFWDVSGAVPPPQTEQDVEDAKDIPPIHTWLPTAQLGDSVQGGAADPDGLIVVMVRGELLRRYPNTIVYMAEAEWSGDQRVPKLELGVEVHEHPIFTGRLDADVQFFAFGLGVPIVRGGGLPDGGPVPPPAGWFVVFQEQPTEPRVGMDDNPQAPPLDQILEWEDLAWQSIGVSPGGYVSFAALGSNHQAEGVTWAKNGAHMAHVVLQTPARVLFHCSALIPQSGA